MQVLPITAIIPTRNRAQSLERTFVSLLTQDSFPTEIIVVDGSDNAATKNLLNSLSGIFPTPCRPHWVIAKQLGAAPQRNQGCELATQPVYWFFDDDIVFDAECLNRLWRGLQSDPGIGGVSALITNQRYHPPGLVSRTLFALLNGRRERTYAGRILGPAVNLLPEDNDDLPEVVPVEWLNTTCTLYRRQSLPKPPFDSVFTGYSLMEDVALSLRVGRSWRLANVRSARIFHDSQPGTHKSDLRALSCMELVNRHYIMTQILHRARARDYAKLCVWEMFQLAVAAKSHRMRAPFWDLLCGKWRAVRNILASNKSDRAHGYENQ